jgi:hypothetical protein
MMGSCHGDDIFTKAQDILLDNLLHVFTDCSKGKRPMKVFLGDKLWGRVATLLIRRWHGSAIQKLPLKLIETGSSVILPILYVVFYLIDVFLLTLNNPAKLLRQKNEIKMRRLFSALCDLIGYTYRINIIHLMHALIHVFDFFFSLPHDTHKEILLSSTTSRHR